MSKTYKYRGLTKDLYSWISTQKQTPDRFIYSHTGNTTKLTEIGLRRTFVESNPKYKGVSVHRVNDALTYLEEKGLVVWSYLGYKGQKNRKLHSLWCSNDPYTSFNPRGTVTMPWVGTKLFHEEDLFGAVELPVPEYDLTPKSICNWPLYAILFTVVSFVSYLWITN